MKTKNILVLIVVIVLIAIVFYSFQGSQDETSFINEIKKDRADKDRIFKTTKESPIPEKEKEIFTDLKYFEPALKYKVIANLTPVKSKKAVVLNTNDGKEQRYLEYAYADFTLDNVDNRLLILEVMDMGPYRGKLFLAFGDETSALETYGAGRYLDVGKLPGSSTITLDFNKAYNPYCAYNNTYSCPLPPLENLLKVAINAGEKTYHN